MAIEVVLPRQGWTMEVGSVVEWCKQDGDEVRAGEILFTLQSDKAVNEIEALDSGILRIPPDSPAIGQEVPVGTVLAYLVEPGEEPPFARTVSAAPPAAPPAAAPELSAAAGPGAAADPAAPDDGRQQRRAGPTISPRARRVAAELGVDWPAVTGSGRTGRIVERDVRAAAPPAPVEPLRVSPATPRTAVDAGAEPGQPSAGHPPAGGVRRVIATRMAHSTQTVAAVTLTTDADATDLVRLRADLKADLAETMAVVPGYNDLLAKLAAVALTEHPALNASWTEHGIVVHGAVDIGIAVETDQGLLVPVVRDVANRSVQQIAAESARLFAAARAGRLGPDDLAGGTFTITNLGVYEVDAFTPIVNLPQCAILGIGRIVARPVVVDETTERVAVRKMVALSLTFDHRVVDGAPAARFLQRVRRFVERPHLWLTR